jgi:hypothetical protein
MMLPRLSRATTKVTRSRRIPGFIAATALSAAVLAAVAVPASASTSSAPQSAAPAVAAAAAVPDTPNLLPAAWTLYGKTYPTKFACRNAGFNLLGTQGILTFKCVEASGGEFLYWQLWLLF